MLDWSYEYQDNICQQITPKTKTNFKKCKTLFPFHLNIICLQLKKQTNKNIMSTERKIQINAQDNNNNNNNKKEREKRKKTTDKKNQ